MEENRFQDNFYFSLRNKNDEILSVPFLQVVHFYPYILQIQIKLSRARLADNFRDLSVTAYAIEPFDMQFALILFSPTVTVIGKSYWRYFFSDSSICFMQKQMKIKLQVERLYCKPPYFNPDTCLSVTAYAIVNHPTSILTLVYP